MKENFVIDWRAVSAFSENAYLIGDKASGEGYFIDPGASASTLIKMAEGLRIKPIGILNTHAHIDHVGAVAELKKHYGIKFYLHKSDEIWVKSLGEQSRAFGVGNVEIPEIDAYLSEGDELKMGGFTIKVLHTPGHSEGGVCFYIPEASVLISGDTLFEGSIGRTDFPGGDYKTLINSIKQKLLILPEETKVYSGHGGVTTIGREKDYNPFLQ